VPHANRFDHGQAERLRPIDREQQSQRAPEKFVLLRSVVSLAQLSGVVFSRLFDAFEISAHSSGPAFVRSPRKFQGRLSTEWTSSRPKIGCRPCWPPPASRTSINE
jgi:hypothetical protein